MSFNSLEFWLVFPFIFLFYWAIPAKYGRWRKLFLLVTSYLLYMNWQPAFALILFGITVLTWWGAKLLDRQTDSAARRKRLVLFLSVLVLLPLCIFKYHNFINSNLNLLLEAMGLKFALPGLNWAIPVGISFFTFQALGYMLDVYYRRIQPEENFTDYMLFVSFFPQVASGPISKASELLPQIKASQPFDGKKARQGLEFLLWGMFLKLALADRMGIYVDKIVGDFGSRSGADCWLASVFYSLQIYGDFAGYSLIAIGIAKLIGLDLINNFERPYLAVSITDFWRRWHISLSRWLRDYVYIPMGGSRCTKARNYWNIAITFLVSGIWHGANWTFIIWGLLHGLAQIIEKMLGVQKCKSKNFFVRAFRVVLTFTIVNFAWIFFRMPTIGEAGQFIGKIFTDFSGHPDLMAAGKGNAYYIIVAVLILLCKDFHDEYPRQNLHGHRIMKWALWLFIAAFTFSCGALESGSFIYVNF